MKNHSFFHTYPLHRYWKALLPGFLYRTSSKSKRDKVKYLSLVSIEAEMSECAQFSHKHLTHQSILHSWCNHSSWLSTLNHPSRCGCPPLSCCWLEGEGCQALPCPTAVLALCPVFCTPWFEVIHDLQHHRALKGLWRHHHCPLFAAAPLSPKLLWIQNSKSNITSLA